MWDLAEAKLIRTLGGHRSGVRCVSFHPFGEVCNYYLLFKFFGSGSADLSLKIWDVRRKGCIQTYHGHSDSIETIEISPDGRWVASGSIDGTVKIWDMTAGKLLHTFHDATGPIHSIAFNPSEFVLSSCSADGYSRVYDLQTFEKISDYSDCYAEKLLFSSDGQDLLVACQNSLQVLTWEPISLVCDIPVQWNQINSVKDFRILPEEDKAIACVTNGAFVEVWGFQLKQVWPEIYG